MIGTNGDIESRTSVLSVRIDDDEDIFIMLMNCNGYWRKKWPGKPN